MEMERQKVVFSDNLSKILKDEIAACEYDRLFVLTDVNTGRLCLPMAENVEAIRDARKITIGAGDSQKNIETISQVWRCLQEGGATRHSLMVNLGGGMVTDLGGFAASTFKRGIKFINIPTTLLSMVDASVGGKTGINFGGLKNEIGVFSNANSVIIDSVFLTTMDHENILSGYAEMLKHALISNEQMWSELTSNEELTIDNAQIADSVAVKQRIVLNDPTENGLRKALNFGHTIGHAFESLALKRKPILHGYAVAYGIVCELYLSCVKTGFPTDKMRQTVKFINENYGRMEIKCSDYPELLEMMSHDKKNVAGTINFTLLSGFGNIRIDQTASAEEIKEALDFYREN
jgi:3-dehydroquinate synthase